MARELFVDASFWTALFYSPDQRHPEALTIWREIIAARWGTVTTNWTLYETLTFLTGRGRHYVALQVHTFVSQSTSIVHIENAGLEDRSLEIFRQHSDKRWSVVDCANFACIEQNQCEYALAYDGDFRQAQAEFKFNVFGV